MNLIVSNYFNEDFFCNTTGDYNICDGLKFISKKFDNFCVLGQNVFIEHKLSIYENAVKYFNMDINSVTSIQQGFEYLTDYPKHVKQFKYIVDIHGHDINQYTNMNLLLPYSYCYNIYNYTKNANIYFFPHCTKFSVGFNNNPINKILVSGRGRKNPNRYPMRVFMYQLSLKNEHIDYLKPDHGYRIYDKNYFIKSTCGENFVKKLNEYLVCFVDDMIHYSPYLVCKFFEVLSSGSLLLACLNYTKKYFNHLGFIENKHYILITKENYKEKIDFILDPQNRELIDIIRYDGYNLCNKYHTSKHRAMQLKEIIEEKDSVVKYNDGIGGSEYFLVNNHIL